MAPTAPYANDHRDTNGPGDARPNALKIIRDEGLDVSLQGKVCLITGGTAGIGIETARAMHATGADVYITGRDTQRGVAVAESLTSDGKPGKVVFLQMSLDSVEDVSAAAAQFLSMSENSNIVICNAGGSPMLAYGASKTACIWMANEIERRYGREGLHATSVHPGAIHTEAARHNPSGDAVMLKTEMRKYRKSPEQGAATTIWAAVGKRWESSGGRYLAEVQEAEPLKDNDTSFPRLGYASHAYDQEAEQRLWDMTVEHLRTKQ
ncbi:putative oxidoreductase [Colletotrichum viniferum]|nr:putative oxidoreductase [Colletotrichum viniferum]